MVKGKVERDARRSLSSRRRGRAWQFWYLEINFSPMDNGLFGHEWYNT